MMTSLAELQALRVERLAEQHRRKRSGHQRKTTAARRTRNAMARESRKRNRE